MADAKIEYRLCKDALTGCKFGAKCRFAHPQLDQIEALVASQRGRPEATAACRDFNGPKGECRRTECTFLHFKMAAQGEASKSCKFGYAPAKGHWPTGQIAPSGVCKAWNTPEGCKFGAKCKFQHIRASQMSESTSRQATSRPKGDDKRNGDLPHKKGLNNLDRMMSSINKVARAQQDIAEATGTPADLRATVIYREFLDALAALVTRADTARKSLGLPEPDSTSDSEADDEHAFTRELDGAELTFAAVDA